jgi:methylphosphotriester-DNA--protein-cysteine methyltransferase
MKALRAIVFYLVLVACTAPSSEAQTVYITKTGTKYHRASCQYLRKSQFAITMKEAVDRGYQPCSVCEPGSLPAEKKSTQGADPKSADPNTTKQQPTPKKTTPADTQQVKSQQCSAITKAGTRCKRMTTDPSGKCYQHK